MIHELQDLITALWSTGRWWARATIATTVVLVVFWQAVLIAIALTGNHDAVAVVSLAIRATIVGGFFLALVTAIDPLVVAAVMQIPQARKAVQTAILGMGIELVFALYLSIVPVEKDPGLLSIFLLTGTTLLAFVLSGAEGRIASTAKQFLFAMMIAETAIFFFGGRAAVTSELSQAITQSQRQTQQAQALPAPAPVVAPTSQPFRPAPTVRRPTEVRDQRTIDIGPGWTRVDLPASTAWWSANGYGGSGCYNIRYPEGGRWNDGTPVPAGYTVKCPKGSDVVPYATSMEFGADRPMKILIEYRYLQ